MGANCARPEPPQGAEKTFTHTSSHEFREIGPAGSENVKFEIELDGGWQPFEPMIAAMLVDAYTSGQHEIEYSARRQTYVVNLHKMLQVNGKTGKSRRIRRVVTSDNIDNNVVPAADMLPPLHEGGGDHLTPSVPASFPKLLQLGEIELRKLKSSPSAIEEFILGLPQANELRSRTADVKKENSRMVKSVASKLTAAAHKADSDGEQRLQDALAVEGVMSAVTIAGFKECMLQAKMDKHRLLLTKKKLEVDGADWSALISTPATSHAGL
mmetsp:Transcript_94967/g.188109  ORF Transcript_94967/g.188109 Transcript_94967/m.188109 type:complete len:269 (+) Transcript_94967:97-903(+)